MKSVILIEDSIRFSVVMNAGKDKWLSDDGGHFTPEASELLGKSVASFIRRHL